MKRNKLYTVNKWNRLAFMPKEKNFFVDGGNKENGGVNDTTNSGNKRLSGQDWASMGASGAEGLIAAFGDKNHPKYSSAAQGNGFAFVDNQLAGGKKNAVGMGGVNTGATLMDTGLKSNNPYLMLAGGIAGTVGTIINAGWGIGTDEDKLNAINKTIAEKENYVSRANTFDDLSMTSNNALTNTDVYEGGWFTKSDARDKNRELRQRVLDAQSWVDRSLANNINNINQNQLSYDLANYSAYGGPIGFGMEPQGPMFDRRPSSMGAIEYGFMSDYLTNKKQQTEQKNQMNNMFAGMPNSMFANGGTILVGKPQDTLFAFGGDMQSNYGDFSTGLTHVDAGGSHEENPNDGVQMGVDNQNVPNLVEEGETVWNDYVFSNRITCDETTKKMFHLPKKKDITYAEVSKKLEKEIQERPNDPISKAGFNAQMEKLEEQQERQKQEMEAKRAKAAFEALSPEEQTAVIQQVAQQEAARENLAAQAEPTGETVETVAEQPVMAEGGHLLPWGGYEKLFSVEPPYSPSNGEGFIPYDRKFTPKEVEKLEQEQRFIDWTNYVNEHWDDEYVQNYLKALDKAAGGNHLFDTEGNLLPTAKDYYNHARTKNHLWGYYHLTPEQVEKAKELQEVNPDVPKATRGYTPTIEDVDPEAAKVLKVASQEGKPLDTRKPDEEIEEEIVVPKHRAGWLRYAGLFGPAAGLGMMAAGIGKPDYSGLDAAVEQANKAPVLAQWKPIGNYLSYRPMDIWYAQNRMDANARATDRAIANSASPAKIAGLLANGYNSQLGAGELFRQALDYNNNLRERAATFNRGTDQYNSQAYNQNQQFNANALNQNTQFGAQMRMNAAQQKMDADAGWYNSLYGNVSGLFKGIGDLGRENEQYNWLSDLAADGYFGQLGTSNTSKRHLKTGRAKGGKIRRKRGLTY